MADQYINQLNDYPSNTDGYVAVGSVNGNGGGKKLLSTITPDASNANVGQVLTVNSQHKAAWMDNTAIPPIPADADEKQYTLGIVDGTLAWVELETAEINSGTIGNVDVLYK